MNSEKRQNHSDRKEMSDCLGIGRGCKDAQGTFGLMEMSTVGSQDCRVFAKNPLNYIPKTGDFNCM